MQDRQLLLKQMHERFDSFEKQLRHNLADESWKKFFSELREDVKDAGFDKGQILELKKRVEDIVSLIQEIKKSLQQKSVEAIEHHNKIDNYIKNSYIK